MTGTRKVGHDSSVTESKISRMYTFGSDGEVENISAKVSDEVLNVEIPRIVVDRKKDVWQIKIVEENIGDEKENIVVKK